jgi:hypothetical protein
MDAHAAANPLNPSTLDLSHIGADPLWLPVSTAAAKADRSEWTLRGWIKANRIVAARSADNRVYIFWPSLEALVAGEGVLIADGTGPAR